MTREESAMRQRLAKFLRFVALTTGVVAVMVAFALILGRDAGAETRIALLAACGTSWLASVCGALPLLQPHTSGAETVTVVMSGTAIRLFMVLAAAVTVTVGGLVAAKPYLLGLVGSYVGLLILDTIFAQSMLRKVNNAEAR